MKTNQLMTRKIGDYEVFQRTKDGMFNATVLLQAWNNATGEKKEVKKFFENENTKEFLDALVKEENLDGQNSAYVKSKARLDRGGGTWMHPILFMKFAMWLNPRFEVQVIKFVYDQMLRYRDEVGEDYKKLAATLAKITPKNEMRELMEHIGKGINCIVYGKHEKMLRNKLATEEQQKEYLKLQSYLIMSIENGIFKNGWDVYRHLLKMYDNKYKPF